MISLNTICYINHYVLLTISYYNFIVVGALPTKVEVKNSNVNDKLIDTNRCDGEVRHDLIRFFLRVWNGFDTFQNYSIINIPILKSQLYYLSYFQFTRPTLLFMFFLSNPVIQHMV